MGHGKHFHSSNFYTGAHEQKTNEQTNKNTISVDLSCVKGSADNPSSADIKLAI